MKLLGRRALVTGASQGFGLAVARAFVREGACVALCARNPGQLEQARQSLMEVGIPGEAKVLAICADVSLPGDVEQLVERSLNELGGLEILVCNAGVYGPKGILHRVDWAEWSRTIEINLLGTVLPCRNVLPQFIERRYGKIILLSGGGATKPLPRLSAYATSKAAVVRFGETLAEEVREHGIDVNCVAPGALNTRLLEEVLQAGPEKVGPSFYEQCLSQKASGGTPLDLGAALCVFLASSDSDGMTGKLISAVWDPWQNLPQYKQVLANSDIYTLRRIVPKDRGQEWG
jgi:NAD(P)-dependent dehydrogenase (short-subunit alcohol dehydrogenase family)